MKRKIIYFLFAVLLVLTFYGNAFCEEKTLPASQESITLKLNDVRNLRDLYNGDLYIQITIQPYLGGAILYYQSPHTDTMSIQLEYHTKNFSFFGYTVSVIKNIKNPRKIDGVILKRAQ